MCHTITCCVRDSINGQKVGKKIRKNEPKEKKKSLQWTRVVRTSWCTRAQSTAITSSIAPARRPYREKCVRENVYSVGRYHISSVKPRPSEKKKNKIQSKRRRSPQRSTFPMPGPRTGELGNDILIFISAKIIRFANILLPPPSNENNQLLSPVHCERSLWLDLCRRPGWMWRDCSHFRVFFFFHSLRAF